MNRTNSYFRVQLKRVLQVLPAILLMSLLVYGCMGILAGIFLNSDSFQENHRKYRIGIVGDISGSYLGFGIFAVPSLDVSKYMIDFLMLSEEEAKAELRAGNLTAYAIVPDGFVDSIVYGRNDKPITYIASEGQKRFSSILMDELADVASTIVTRSQSAINGMQTVLLENGREDALWEATDRLDLELLGLVLGRTGLCEMEELGVSAGLSMESFYFCSMLLFFLMLTGLSSSVLFGRRNEKLPMLLASRGVGAARQIAGEYLAYLILAVLCAAEIFLLIGVVFWGGFGEIPEWKDAAMESLPAFFIGCLPTVALLAAMQFFLYEAVSGVVSGILVQFTCVMGMAFVSGYFYPEYFFPETIRRFGELLPTGVLLRYTAGHITRSMEGKELLWMFLYFLLFFGGAIFIRRHKLQRGH